MNIIRASEKLKATMKRLAALPPVGFAKAKQQVLNMLDNGTSDDWELQHREYRDFQEEGFPSRWELVKHKKTGEVRMYAVYLDGTREQRGTSEW